MNQRITVRAIIRKDNKTLFLRRMDGRPEVLGRYQLPGGRIEYGETPQQALERHVASDTGLSIQTVQLLDVLSAEDDGNREIQRFSVIYLVGVVGNTKIRLHQRYDHYVWKKPGEMSGEALTPATQSILNISQQITTLLPYEDNHIDDEETTYMHRLIIYSDGGSRGNPGPSAAGFVVLDVNERILHEGGAYLGITTNNQAEYHGVRLGLEKALEMGARAVDFRIDSLLVVNQMKGMYKIKNRELWPINERIRELVAKFDKVTFTHVKREFNQLADGMVNKILNAHTSK